LFDEWWALYPHKVGKPVALASFDKALKLPGVTYDQILNGLQRYIEGKPPDRQWCNPSTWLNQQRWNDQPAVVQPRRTENVRDKIDAAFAELDAERAKHGFFGH